jgi:3-oxoacyl-[acyl-carrier protein] reductase
MANVLVTGSSRGIGKEIAKLFLSDNNNVIINSYKNIGELGETLEEFKKTSPNVMAIPCNVGNFEEVNNMFDIIYSRLGSIDILINNASISYFGLFNEMGAEDIENIIHTNLMSVIYCSRRSVGPMIKNKSGCIINISSIWSLTGASCEAVYSATKGGVDTFTKSLAKELGPCNIRVNSIACGVIDTKMNSFLDPGEKKSLISDIPLQRMGTPSEIAELCYFLCSSKAKYITGEIIKIDGAFI